MTEAREQLQQVQAPLPEPAAQPAAASPTARLQSALGNRAFGRMLGRATVAREYTETPPVELPDWHGLDGDEFDDVGDGPIELDQPSASPAPTTAAAANNFTRPAPKDIDKTYDDGQAALAYINSGAYIGEAKAKFDVAVSEIQVTGKKGAYTAFVTVTWSTASTSHMELWNPTWPNMSADDKAAVAKMRAALLAHEIGHFEVMEKAVAAFTRIEGTGKTQQAAVNDLRAKAPGVQKGWQAALKKADDDYDVKTKNGRNQAAVGGTDVKLVLKIPAKSP